MGGELIDRQLRLGFTNATWNRSLWAIIDRVGYIFWLGLGREPGPNTMGHQEGLSPVSVIQGACKWVGGRGGVGCKGGGCKGGVTRCKGRVTG